MLELVHFHQRLARFGAKFAALPWTDECVLVLSNLNILPKAEALTIQVLLEMGGLCNSIGSNQVYYEISVEQLIVGKLQVRKKDS